MNTTEKGDLFEAYISFIYKQLLLLERDHSKVQRKVILEKENAKYEIDIYYEFTKAKIKHRVAIECKNRNRPVERKEVACFESYINHLRNITGVMVAKNGFTTGAEEYAKSMGIKLLTPAQLPNFINVIGLNLKSAYLTNENDLAEPFYTILWVNEQGEWTGDYFIEDFGSLNKVMPLFISKKHGQEYIATRQDKDIALRPLRREHINFIVDLSLSKLGGLDDLNFSLIFFPLSSLNDYCPTLKAADLKTEYLS